MNTAGHRLVAHRLVRACTRLAGGAAFGAAVLVGPAASGFASGFASGAASAGGAQPEAGAERAAWMDEARRDGRSTELLELLDRYVLAMLEQDPLSVGGSLNDRRYDDRFGDGGPAATAAWTERQAGFLTELEALDATGFSDDDRLDAGLLRHSLELAIASAPLHREQMPISSIGGPQYWLPQLASFVTVQTERDRANYVARLEQVPVVIGDAIDQMTAGIAAGRVPPRTVVEPAVEQALAQATPAIRNEPAGSPFYRPFVEVDPNDELAVRARELISGEIAEAYNDLALFLQNSYLPLCRETVGISQGVDGVAAYELAIRQHTTLPMTADGVHELGLSEVARIRAEMMDVIRRSDFMDVARSNDVDTETDQRLFDAFIEYLRTDERFYFDEPEELVNAYRVLSKVADPELVKLFGRLPRLPYGVREIPLFAARHSPTAYYYSGSIEQGRPGYFMANTYALDQRPRYAIVPLTLHEAMPGHHLQIALSQEIEGQHPFRRLVGFTAFIEGWGLYAEKLGLEMGEGERGLYADPYDDFGRLNFEMWRALRLVVDSGLHAKGWTEEYAVEYMLAHSALTEVDARAEVKRYIGWPGQALAYKVGELHILGLRAEAEAALGDAFDIRAWHDHLLGAGSMPLPVLSDRMGAWVAARAAAAER